MKSHLMFLRAAGCVALGMVILLAGAASAQTYLDEYKAYNAALESGDADAAAAHGYAAWQAAEQELGDDALTAVLAYNYGQYVLYSNTEGALEALRRADELQQAGIADLPADELMLFLAFSEFSLDSKTNRKRDDLRSALNVLAQQGVPASQDIATMWLILANADFEDSKYEDARVSAEKAEKYIFAADTNNYVSRARAILVQGVSKLFYDELKAQSILDANKDFVRASRLFPVQNDVDTFDSTLALILTWNSAAQVMLRTISNYQDDRPDTWTGSRIRLRDLPDDEIADPTKFLSFDMNAVFPSSRSAESCNMEMERIPPKYPRTALNKWYVGSVMVGYDIDENGVPIKAKILAEVPSQYFGEVVLEALSKWRSSTPVIDSQECRKDLITMFSFELMPE
ncbi:TonB family protein [Hyphococcus sp.]|uniref:TonB family protein n=1 Tax=Hyphococcus sp. TaxID=2038636 RepID=UPI003CCBFDD8